MIFFATGSVGVDDLIVEDAFVDEQNRVIFASDSYTKGESTDDEHKGGLSNYLFKKVQLGNGNEIVLKVKVLPRK